jgi:hypothetical protein
MIALLIAILAVFLALSETLGKSAQTEALGSNIEASNLWAFYQAKTIRQTTLEVAAAARAIDLNTVADAAIKEQMAKQVAGWRATAKRYQSEPKPTGGEGRDELMARAKQAEKKRDDYLAKYHHYEVASAAHLIGMALASATIITGVVALSYAAIGLGVLGLVFMGIGLFAPHAVHLL